MGEVPNSMNQVEDLPEQEYPRGSSVKITIKAICPCGAWIRVKGTSVYSGIESSIHCEGGFGEFVDAHEKCSRQENGNHE